MNEVKVKETDIVEKKYTDKQVKLIQDTYAKGATKEEFELYLYVANKYGLDPLLKQIWCVKFFKKDKTGRIIGSEPAQIYAGRDGFLEIAHRSGMFNGLKSGMKDSKTAYAEVYRKDMQHPFYVEVDMSEYSTGMALWKSKPKTMLIKVAESQALRKAFSVSGIYSPEEMSQWEYDAQGLTFDNKPELDSPPPAGKTKVEFDWSKLNLEAIPKWSFTEDKKPIAPPIVRRLFAISKHIEDFKQLTVDVTGKEHSYKWTYGDIKNIEEAINNYGKEETEVEEVEIEEVEDIEDFTDEERAELEALL